jgi:hypothetical protein
MKAGIIAGHEEATVVETSSRRTREDCQAGAVSFEELFSLKGF